MRNDPIAIKDYDDNISLKSIDIASVTSDGQATDSSSSEDESDQPQQIDEESLQGLTANARRISGTRFVSGTSSTDPRNPPRTPSRQHAKFSRGSPHPYRSSPRSRRSNRSPSPLGRKVSLAVHQASARIVNLSNQRSASPSPRRSNASHRPKPPDGKDYFSTLHTLADEVDPTGLKGKTLGLFSSENKVRRTLCRCLMHPATEPLILLLIIFHMVVLTIDSSVDIFENPGSLHWGGWTDWALLAIFSLYTIEVTSKIVVCGLWRNPVEDSIASDGSATNSHDKSRDPQTRTRKAKKFFSKLRPQMSLLQRDTQGALILRRAYLRHSYNRIDFVAVVSFWIYFALAITGIEIRNHIFIFKTLSCIRLLRLLNITKGTSAILKSLKKAAPLLVNVAFFVGFFWVFIAVIGVQSFRGSFRRQCVWVDPLGIQANQTQYLQFCGGQWEHGVKTSYLNKDWQSLEVQPKGYTCPEQSWCVQNVNPYGGTVHFDNFFNSLELVFVIMSSNTFTDLMYYTMDSDYFTSALFFIGGTLLLTFWLMSLVIAVVTSAFQLIREEQHSSAFTSTSKSTRSNTSQAPFTPSKALVLWQNTNWFWICMIIANVVTQAFKTASMPETTWNNFEKAESVFTSLFAVEILVRFGCHFPYWRQFATQNNFFDLFLAIVTCVIQIPTIKSSGSLYRWLTIFQILRFYRVLLAIQFTRDLLKRVLGNTSGLLNLILFVVCAVYIVALMACQLIRGDAPREIYGEVQEMTFKNIFNSFLGMYQVLSSENWTSILYGVQSMETLYNQAWVGAIFFIVWFVFSQNILMSMFIAVLQENFEISEVDKRREQVRAFFEKSLPTISSQQTNLTMFSLLKRRLKSRAKANHGHGQFGTNQHELNVRQFLEQQPNASGAVRAMTMQDQLQGPLKRLWDRVSSFFKGATAAKINPFSSNYDLPSNGTSKTVDPSGMASEVAKVHEARQLQQIQYLRDNPAYDRVLWILGPKSRIRRFCQKIVSPSTGERLESHAKAYPAVWYGFTAFMYMCTVAIVVLACINTPIYQKVYQITHAEFRFAWFTWCDLAFTLVFTFEFFIKVFADGFWLTPNAYFRDIWNRIDMFVLVTLWVNLIADILDRGELSRAFRAFKALRALRLVNISDATKRTFHDVLIAGFWNIAGAAIVSLALLVPMAIWALNMFSGLLYSCSDDSVDGILQCYSEFASSPSNWAVWAPRTWENPQGWSFDSFGKSLLILFEIVSQEGWIGVTTSVMAITGRGDQPIMDASTINAVFFILFNLLGAVFVLTLFITVIIQNFSERSGTAYLTMEQRSWQEVRLLLKQVRPSRRPVDAPANALRRWCFFAVKKHSTWNRVLIGVYCAHIVLLMSEHFPEKSTYSFFRNFLFLIFNVIYTANMIVRILGLGWRLFLKSRWNIYNLVVVAVSFTLTIIIFRAQAETLAALLTADKVFLVLVAMNMIPAIDSLDQLFKTTAGALPDLASLMATWLVLFVTFAIAFNQIFGLTKIGANGSDNLNFRTIPKSLVVLFRMSCGEGWNSIMHDHTISAPYCTDSSNFYESDCGSESWAFFLFISWNILSMYIFVNIVISLVYNNFSYVYQRAGNMANISRAELRNFKATWAEFDDGTGHIQKQQISKFLSCLTGAFEVKIYPVDYAVPQLIASCQQQNTGSSKKTLCLETLHRAMDNLDVDEVQRRRAAYKRLYTELMQYRGNKAVSFTTMLLTIAQHKFVDENSDLGIAEYLARRTIRSNVDQALSRETIINFFELLRARELLRQLQESKGNTVARKPVQAQLQIPRQSLRIGSSNPSPTSATSPHRHSWRLAHSDTNTSLRSRTPSPGAASDATSSTTGHGEGINYDSIFAGSAWQTVLDEAAQEDKEAHRNL